MTKKKEEKQEEIEITQTPEQIEEVEQMDADLKKAEILKKNYKTKRVFLIEVEDEDTGEWIGGWIRKPNLKEFSMFTKLAQKDNLSALQTLMTNIFLEGDRRIYEDDDYFLGSIAQIQDIVNVQASRIKKF